MNSNYVNIRLILDKITRHPLMQDVSVETVIDYTVDFFRLVGVPNMFVEKTEILTIENYRALLPEDFQDMIQVRKNDHNKFSFRYSTDNFHYSDAKQDIDYCYKLQGGIIYTSIEKGEIEISYRAMQLDDCGYIMIPDNSSFTRALELYIKKQWFTILFDLGKINPAILQNTKQEYAWAVGDCETEFKRLNIDQMESFCNSWRTLLIRDYQHQGGFRTNGTKEIIKKH